MTTTRALKAIETLYRGYRFRSRLEARWAVFFDALDVAWRYEPEGFDVDGRWYLPDFHLPGPDVWVEIKGALDPAEAAALHGLLAAASMGLGRPFVALVGEVGWPWLGPTPLGETSPALLIVDRCPDRARSWEWFNSLLHSWSDSSVHQWVSLLVGRLVSPEVIYEASRAARGARFEHGELGASPAAPATAVSSPEDAAERDAEAQHYAAWVAFRTAYGIPDVGEAVYAREPV